MEMMDTRFLNRAFGTYTEAVHEASAAYRRGFESMLEVQDRNLSLSRDWYEKAGAEFRRQVEASVAVNEEIVDRVLEQRAPLQSFVEGTVESWMDLYFAQFGYLRHGMRFVEEAGDELSEATLEAVDSAAATVESVANAAFPVADYDELNVEQVKAKAEGLSAAEIRTLRDYEKSHKNRETLVGFFDRKLRAKSA